MKRERKTQRKGGDPKNGKVEGGAAVCAERLREGREEDERGRASLHLSLFLAQAEQQRNVHVTVKANEIIFSISLSEKTAGEASQLNTGMETSTREAITIGVICVSEHCPCMCTKQNGKTSCGNECKRCEKMNVHASRS